MNKYNNWLQFWLMLSHLKEDKRTCWHYCWQYGSQQLNMKICDWRSMGMTAKDTEPRYWRYWQRGCRHQGHGELGESIPFSWSILCLSRLGSLGECCKLPQQDPEQTSKLNLVKSECLRSQLWHISLNFLPQLYSGCVDSYEWKGLWTANTATKQTLWGITIFHKYKSWTYWCRFT